MRSILLPLAIVTLFLGACSRPPKPTPAAPPAPGAADAALAALALDGGQPWTSDEHTREQIAAMNAAVQAAIDDPSPAATAKLGRQLQDIADALVAGCTMKGKAHEALHVYLGALLPAVQAMSATDATTAQAARTRTAALLARFGDYFR